MECTSLISQPAANGLSCMNTLRTKLRCHCSNSTLLVTEFEVKPIRLHWSIRAKLGLEHSQMPCCPTQQRHTLTMSHYQKKGSVVVWGQLRRGCYQNFTPLAPGIDELCQGLIDPVPRTKACKPSTANAAWLILMCCVGITNGLLALKSVSLQCFSHFQSAISGSRKVVKHREDGSLCSIFSISSSELVVLSLHALSPPPAGR